MATTAAASGAPSAHDLAQQILSHKAPSYSFNFSPFLRDTYGHGLAPNRPVCKHFLAGHCPQGTLCPDRHDASASAAAAGSANASYNSLVCKHWLRALCKKGESCEFLHEYNLRKMPECNFFVRNGYCSNGDECLYLHIDPQSKLPPCPHYERGFCPLGPNCSKKHVRRRLCPYYLAGFCPDGRECLEGTHPRFPDKLEPPIAKSEAAAREEQARREEAALAAASGKTLDDDPREFGGRMDRDGGRGGRGDRFGGGRGGRWRGRGDRKFRGGRGHH